ncbi:Extracellular deoxyribonuclease PA3909 (required for catabolism of external DNA) [Methylomonas albis]|uniref:ExeM/NucH family extracellular endonuclease n=1 Tax=Methylomonas albis TaxID=1854563 RepID=A0ABR9D3D5_9GAMM|nr:ExeM/NucH family extracellular endonuclease [Methylomonas albis]MBD9357445.1 ExeM/NucH family extracellular endonuclease [Methylomonas albis]CAD6880711.1 Extracellular deoxyribonuclease PA3909 (required for catabolism of external DNA) [Methylomonas albis]
MIAKNMRSFPLLAAVSTLGFFGNAQAATPVFINEIHYDNSGTDSGEAIEIAGPAGTNLSGWSLVLYNGNGGASYNTKALSGVIADQSGTGFGTLSFSYPTDGIQNGAPDGMALVNGSTVVQFLSYEGSFTAVGGPAAGKVGVDIGVSESSVPVGQSLQLKGTGSSYEDFTWAAASANTFGSSNTGQTFGGSTPPPPTSQCGQPATLISAIQGSAGVSPLNGSVQHVEAVVSADFQDSSNLSGFFVQQGSDSDNNPATSEGLFVVSNIPVNAGDKVHIIGTVAEPFGMTRLESISSVEVCSSSNALPAAAEVSLPFDSAGNDPERWEGMLVQLPQTLSVTENYNLARYGEFLLSSGGRLLTPTQVAAPGQAANDVAAQNLLNQLLVDDGSNTQNPDPVIYPQPTGLSATTPLRSGDAVVGATGVLAYDFGVYRLQPTQPLTFVAANARGPVPALSALGSLKIASFNVLNYFNGNGVGGGFPTARGANTLAEFNRQRDKIIPAIHALNADVVGLMEIENDGYGSTSAIADLVNGLNQLAGAGTYAFINPGLSKVGSDEIAVGILYKPAKVSVVGNVAILDSSINPQFIDTKNRPTLAQTFLDKASNKLLTVAVNHLKSKGSDCVDVNDPDTGDGQGNCNQTRTAAAQALASWLAGDPTHNGASNALIIGDLNSYAQEDPISTLKNAGYQNLLETFVGNQVAYSYVFDGAAGYLDHGLANTSLAPQVKAAGEWHINADEPRALDYNTEFKTAGQISSFYAADAYRSSDHDPLLIKLFVPGDLDNDGDVDASDANLIKAQVGKCSGKVGFNREADYDATGCVTYADYRIWYGYYNSYTASASAQ